jgi:hypothetical protein
VKKIRKHKDGKECDQYSYFASFFAFGDDGVKREQKDKRKPPSESIQKRLCTPLAKEPEWDLA